MADCGPGQKLMAPDDCRDVAIIDEDGNAQKIKRDHWIVWKLEIDCLHSLIDIGLTSAYTHNGTIVANTATEENQMVHYRLQNNADVNTGINPYQGALAKVGGNPFDLSAQTILDYLAESDQLPTNKDPANEE